MMFRVYAITDRPDEPLPNLLGVENEITSHIVWRDIAAVVGARGAGRAAPTADELWRHEEIVELLMATRTVLPVRFGTFLPSEQDISVVLSRAYAALVQDIARVRGHVEIGMRFIINLEQRTEGRTGCTRLRIQAAPGNKCHLARPLSGPSGSPGNRRGTAYLQGVLARQREVRDGRRDWLRTVLKVHEALAADARASTLNDARDDRPDIAAAFLVSRDRIASFRRRVNQAAQEHPELALFCTGPWPPYSFVNGSENVIGSY